MLNLLGIFKKKEKQEILPETQKEKVDAIFRLVNEIRDELKPLGPDGERLSRLQMINEAVLHLSPDERKKVKEELESLEIDEQIFSVIEKPKTIEEISKKIKRSYGYTANRLRKLLKDGKAMRKRDAVTRKYVYIKV